MAQLFSADVFSNHGILWQPFIGVDGTHLCSLTWSEVGAFSPATPRPRFWSASPPEASFCRCSRTGISTKKCFLPLNLPPKRLQSRQTRGPSDEHAVFRRLWLHFRHCAGSVFLHRAPLRAGLLLYGRSVWIFKLSRFFKTDEGLEKIVGHLFIMP